VRRHTVEKPAVVRDKSAPIRRSLEGVLQARRVCTSRSLARLVQQQHIGTGFSHLWPMDAIPLPPGERADFLLLIRAGQIEAGYIGAGIDQSIA